MWFFQPEFLGTLFSLHCLGSCTQCGEGLAEGDSEVYEPPNPSASVSEPYNWATFSPSLERERERKEKKRKNQVETFILWTIRLSSREVCLAPKVTHRLPGSAGVRTRVPKSGLLSWPCLTPPDSPETRWREQNPGLGRVPDPGPGQAASLWKDPWPDPSPCWASRISLESPNMVFQGCYFQPGILGL